LKIIPKNLLENSSDLDDSKNVLVHSKNTNDQSSGYDIALIGIEKNDYEKIE
jgi:hypothetical protein